MNQPSYHTIYDPAVPPGEVYLAAIGTPPPTSAINAKLEGWLKISGISLDEWQRRTMAKYFGINFEEQDYIRNRLNARLRGDDPGPYQKDPMKR